MIQSYLDLLNTISPLESTTREILIPHISIEQISKGEFILNYQAVCDHIYYIESGFARQYYFRNGKEITEWFAGTGNFCSSIASYFNGEPSNLLIEAIEDTTVIKISREGLLGLSKTNLEIAQLAVTWFSKSLIMSQQRVESILFQSAKERYAHLLEQQPHIIQKVQLAHIASFLGITQETLSRIRAKR